MITIYTPPFTGDYDLLFVMIGMFLIIFGALIEVHSHTEVKKSIQSLEERIHKLEKHE